VLGSSKKLKKSTRKKRTTANSSKGASSSLDEELNPSNLLTQGEELPEPNSTQPRPNQDATGVTAKVAYKAELTKLRKEAEELAKPKKGFWRSCMRLWQPKKSKGKKPKLLNIKKSCVS
jgi:hypothetical protein